MKIRSNMDRVWSLAGLRMEPGVVINFDILKCRDIRQLKAVLQEIEKGNISIVEQDNLFKQSTVIKVQPEPIKKESQEDLIVVTKQGTFKDEIPADVLEEPKEVVQEPVKIQVEVQPEVVVKEGGIKNESEETGGFVVIPGKKPGEGQLKTVSAVIQEKTDEIAEVLKDATKELADLNKKEDAVIKDIPENIDNILKMKANERKLYIAKIEDKDLLVEISKYTKVKSILNIVSQRLEELK